MSGFVIDGIVLPKGILFKSSKNDLSLKQVKNNFFKKRATACFVNDLFNGEKSKVDIFGGEGGKETFDCPSRVLARKKQSMLIHKLLNPQNRIFLNDFHPDGYNNNEKKWRDA